MTKPTINSLALAATHEFRNIDSNIARCLKSITDALQLAHKEIEELKAQLNQQK